MGDFLDIIPWEDVLFERIFPYLGVQDLFRFRATNSKSKRCVDQYFQVCSKIRLIDCGRDFKKFHFEILSSKMKGLRKVMIRNANSWLTHDIIRPLLLNNKNLKCIDLDGSITLQEKTAQVIAICCRNLQTLSLQRASWLTDNALNEIAVNCDGLKSLNLSGCWSLTDSSITQVATLCVQ